MVRAEGGSLRFWGPGLLSTSPAFSMSSASHSAGSSGRLAQKTGAGPTFQWAGKVDAICRSRSDRAKRPRAGCIFRSGVACHQSHLWQFHTAPTVIFLHCAHIDTVFATCLMYLIAHNLPFPQYFPDDLSATEGFTIFYKPYTSEQEFAEESLNEAVVRRHTIRDLFPDTDYVIRMISFNSAGSSDLSNIVVKRTERG